MALMPKGHTAFVSKLLLWLSFALVCSGSPMASAAPNPDNRLELQLLQSQYLSETQNSVQTDSYSSVSLRYKLNSTRSGFIYGLDVMGMGSVDGSEQGYVAVPELFLGFKPRGTPFHLVFGRKRESWSKFDDEWRLGIWQPAVRWDYLNPQSQGLTGAFLGFNNDQISVLFFATPVFLPDQGPQFEIVNGEFHSSNRWFRQPQNHHQVVEQERPLNYALDKPKERDIAMNGGFGLSVLVGKESLGPWLKTSLANKPVNQLHLALEGYHNISTTGLYDSVVTIHPMVARHSVATVEAGYTQDEYKWWVSVTEERPHPPSVPESWEESALNPTRFLGAAFSHRLPWQGMKTHWLKYSVMTSTQDIPAPKQGLMEDQLESSLNRYPYKEVVSVEWMAPFIESARRRLDVGVRYLYSIPEQGSLLSAKLEMMLTPQMRWDLGFDILGALINPSDPKSGLMSQYRNNDRVLGGFTYVF